LLAGLIDYAGLFPPASLAMADAVSRYAGYRRGPHAWMLGRFIVPCARLDEFDAARRALADSDVGAASPSPSPSGPVASCGEADADADADAGARPWRVSVLAGSAVAADRVAIEAFNARYQGVPEAIGDAMRAARVATPACIDAVEVKVDAVPDVARIAITLDGPWRVWFEVAPGPALGSMLEAIASAGDRAGAKVRTGGVTPAAIPASSAVAQFLLACARAGVACKATAGLHHPLRAPQRLTYAADSPTAPMHGFVNVFLAATLARVLMSHQHADESIVSTLVEMLDERDPRHLAWHDDRVVWRAGGQYSLGVSAILSTRERFACSFGSCSFDEPIADLQHLGWL
jgi:hypothetical protein